MPYLAGRRDRRQRDRDQQRAAANRRIGHDYAYAIVGGPFVAKVVGLLALAAGLWWTWLHVDHRRISLVIFALGLLCVLVYAGWFIRAGSNHARMMQRATGQIPSSPWLWHLLALAGVLLMAAAYLIYVP